jgi:hypothetical protein
MKDGQDIASGTYACVLEAKKPKPERNQICPEIVMEIVNK